MSNENAEGRAVVSQNANRGAAMTPTAVRLQEIKARCEKATNTLVEVPGRHTLLFSLAYTDIPYLLSLVEQYREGLTVIKKALNDDIHTTHEGFHPARKLADELGIYNDDLDGMRVLYKIAERLLRGDTV